MEYNIYCDESCHLEHDGEKAMVIGGIKCPRNFRKQIIRGIFDIKAKHSIPPNSEIKWTKISPCNTDYFKDLIDYFFSCELLIFRAVVIDKEKLKHDQYKQTHNDFYYKMYFYCLSGLLEPQSSNCIYIDKKDTKGTTKIKKLKSCLDSAHDFNLTTIKRIQCVTSSELPILQLADLIIGAIGYNNREIEHGSAAKKEIVKHIQKKSGYSLKRSTILAEKKFNLFFINLS